MLLNSAIIVLCNYRYAFVYLLILAKRYVDAKASESKIFTDLHARIVLLNESMDRIEKKVDNIESILEKVSE